MTEQQTIYDERLEWLGANAANAGGRSDKFYEVTVVRDGHRYVETRRWGRFGTKGQSKVLTHYYEGTALSSAREQLAAKRRKGYTSPVAPLKRLASIMEDD